MSKTVYVTARWNPGAGIGHQFTAYGSAYSLAQHLGLVFAHQPLAKTHADWERFIPLGNDEVQFSELNGPVIRVPKFEFTRDRAMLERIIRDAPDGAILHLEEDQYIPWCMFSVDKLKAKFPKRERSEKVMAVHVRRGQIMEWTPEERAGRFLPNSYFARVIEGVKRVFPDIRVHVYSMGTPAEFTEFSADVTLHLAKDEYDSPIEHFYGLMDSDIVVVSRSSFSIMAAMLTDTIKIVHPFWTMISNFSPNPETIPPPDKWIQCDIDGNFNLEELNVLR